MTNYPTYVVQTQKIIVQNSMFLGDQPTNHAIQEPHLVIQFNQF